MSECLVTGTGGGGAKIYTLENCKVKENVITLPPGVTFGKITELSIGIILQQWGDNNFNPEHIFLRKDTRELLVTSYHSPNKPIEYHLASDQPKAEDTTIKSFPSILGGNLPVIYHLIMVVG